MPINLMIEPTNRCNLKCPLCPTGARELGYEKTDMTFGQFKNIVDELKNWVSRIELWGYGEPLLCKDIFLMVKYAAEAKIKTEISTNGVLLCNEEIAKNLVLSGLDRLRVSLDGACEETLKKYRIGANIQDILYGIDKISYFKKLYSSVTPYIIIQFIVMKHNEHEIDDMKKIAKMYNVSLKLKTIEINQTTTSDAECYLPTNEKYSRYRYDAYKNKLEPIEAQPRLCYFPYEMGVINSDGSIAPCCKDPYRNHLMGSLLGKSFAQIWRSQQFKSFRNNLKKRTGLKTCDGCVLPRKISV